jgi:hypothetical protein
MAVAVRAMLRLGAVVSVSRMVAAVVSDAAVVDNAVAVVGNAVMPRSAGRMLGSVMVATAMAIGSGTATLVLDAAAVVAAGMLGAAMVAVVVAMPGMP